ncbi:glycosyltransferase family 4 protein [Methylococcus capsulatus]|uniref:glycosyltransferase family 4 protein n=1 Tax=Methylococcus capsulatus TaxID=414 RepID=UPI001C53012C|nr:glycosyltransferase family 4 protein [Methylococcus capsulatus]QXP88110.1 glycosyltransferase family 4 protein [Methylococcus capsulatus]
MTIPDFVVVTDIPSPHQVEFFDEMHRSGLNIGIIYVRHRDPLRRWSDAELGHPHAFIDGTAEELKRCHRWIREGRLTVISGYAHPLQRQWMKYRETERKPWCFWGERPGVRSRSWIGKYYRRMRLQILLKSKAPIWGIGQWGIEGYRNEFGSERPYFNVPYFSNLTRFKTRPNDREYFPKTILFSGQLIDRKGIIELASSFVAVARKYPDIRLRVLGEGPLRERVTTLLRTVTPQVDLIGFRDWSELPGFYHSSDIVCVPSKYDGWGMFVPEAMAAGCPVITTTVTGAAVDLIENGVNGWMIPPANVDRLTAALEEAISLDSETYRLMRQRAMQSAQTVDISRGVDVFAEAAEESVRLYSKL